MTKSLGVNAQSFANHLTRGIEAAGLNVDDFQPGIVTHRKTEELVLQFVN